jgi:WD40 repeat protein
MRKALRTTFLLAALTTAARGAEPKVITTLLGGGVTPPFTAVAFSPDGKQVAFAGGHDFAAVWDSTTRMTIKLDHGSATGQTLFFSADGKLVTGSREGPVKVWVVAEKDERSVGDRKLWQKTAAMSPDGKLLAYSVRDEAGNVVRIFNVKDRKEVAVTPAFQGEVFAVAFGPDGKSVAAASTRDRAPRWFSVETGKAAEPGGELKSAHPVGISGMAGSYDGKTLITWDRSPSSGRKLLIWEFGKPDATAPADAPDEVLHAAISGDGKTVAVVPADGSKVILFDSAGKTLRTINPPDGKTFFCAALSNDAKMAAAADSTKRITLYDLSAGK